MASATVFPLHPGISCSFEILVTLGIIYDTVLNWNRVPNSCKIDDVKVGIDVSQAVYGTGVSDYTIDLFSALTRAYPHDQFLPVGFSLRRRRDLVKLFPRCLTYPIPPTVLHLLWNHLHVVNFESFSGPIAVYHSSDWAQAPSRVPKITTVHDLAPLLFPAEHHPQTVAVHQARLKRVVADCDRIICVSANTQFDLHRLFPAAVKRTCIIPEALPSRFLLPPRPPNIQDPYLLAIGSRQPRKNIPRLISAYLRFKNQFRLPPKLIIVGENSFSPSDPSVIFTGYVPDQKFTDLLAHAACFVYPSLYEGFGLPILGAFYHRIPVAASGTSSIPEVAGAAAVLFDPLNLSQIAQSIKSAIAGRQSLVPRGVAQLKKFSWDKTAAATYRAYQSLC